MQKAMGWGLVFAAAFCFGQAPASTPATGNATYHSEAMGLDFSYPSSFVNKAADAVPEKDADKGGDSKKSCSSLPVTAMDIENGVQHDHAETHGWSLHR